MQFKNKCNLGNLLVSLGVQEFFPGVRLEYSANYLPASGSSLRFGQGVINSWLCTDSSHNLWQACHSKTSHIKQRGATRTFPCLHHAPPLKASQVRNCLWQLVSGLWELEQLVHDTKCICLGARRLQGVSLASLSHRFSEPLNVSSCTQLTREWHSPSIWFCLSLQAP